MSTEIIGQIPISGICPLTTIDYPHHLAAVFFTQGCGYRCSYCHNSELRPLKEGSIPPEKIHEFLQNRRGKLEAIVISGGEPTIHAKLPEFLAYIKSLGFKVGLHTAGANPRRLGLCLPHVHWVGIDVKAPSENKHYSITGTRAGLDRTLASLELLQETRTPHQVRTTLFPGIIGEEDIQEINTLLRDLGESPTTVQAYRPPK